MARRRRARSRCSSPAGRSTRVDAVVFAGGSAFGLAAADGVMRYLAERGQGFPTAGGPVPIVPDGRASSTSLDVGSVRARAPTRATRRPTRRRATSRSRPAASVRGAARPSGSGAAASTRCRAGSASPSARVDDAHVVAALAVVNAVGDVVGDDGTVLAGSTAPPDAPAFPRRRAVRGKAARGNTTLVVVVDRRRARQARLPPLAQSAHDGLAQSLRPAHTRYDGDLVVALATGRRRGAPRPAATSSRPTSWPTRFAARPVAPTPGHSVRRPRPAVRYRGVRVTRLVLRIATRATAGDDLADVAAVAVAARCASSRPGAPRSSSASVAPMPT